VAVLQGKHTEYSGMGVLFNAAWATGCHEA
jgi:hypothetical protein